MVPNYFFQRNRCSRTHAICEVHYQWRTARFGVGLDVFLQMITPHEFLVTLGTLEPLLPGVSAVMPL